MFSGTFGLWISPLKRRQTHGSDTGLVATYGMRVRSRRLSVRWQARRHSALVMWVAASQKPMHAWSVLPPPPGRLGLVSLPVAPDSAALPTPVVVSPGSPPPAPVREPPPLLSIIGPGTCDIEGRGDRLGAGVPAAERGWLPEDVVGDGTPVWDVLPSFVDEDGEDEARGAAVLPPEPARCACAAAGSIPTTTMAVANQMWREASIGHVRFPAVPPILRTHDARVLPITYARPTQQVNAP